MPRVPLLGGAYSAKSPIANAQKCINLYPEINPETSQAPVNVTHYPRAGRTRLGSPPAPGKGRCLYTSTANQLFANIDQAIYYIDPDWNFNLLGALIDKRTTPSSMSDNGFQIAVVDGSSQGFTIDMDSSHAFAQISDPNFLGADRADYIDSFLTYNQPGTPNWYTSLSNQVAFSALDFGTKTAWPDNIVTQITIEREVWLLGSQKSEIWVNAGAPGFAFQALPGIIVEWGCAAKYSVVKMDINIFWLARSPEGSYVAVKSEQHGAKRISNFAIEDQWRKYPRVDDAIGSSYQLGGHLYYKLDFPLADKTWVYDVATDQWHEEAYTDVNGILRRMRDSFTAFAYGQNVTLDWANGDLYKIDQDNYTDNANPISCIRAMPHVIGDDFERVTYHKLIADIEVGTTPNTFPVEVAENSFSIGFSPGFGPDILTEPPMISLRLSRNRGGSYGNKIMQPMGAAGLYSTRPTWNRLGYGIDLVSELSWSSPMKTALNGVFLDIEPHDGENF